MSTKSPIELTSAEKCKAIKTALLHQEFALIHLNPRVANVDIPEHLAKDPSVTLKLSKMFRGNLEVLDFGVRAELLFKGEYYNCVVPWEAIWGASDPLGKTKVWPQSMPTELAIGLVDKDSDKDTDKNAEKENSPSIMPDKLDSFAEQPSDQKGVAQIENTQKEVSPKTKVSHLRRIK